jgi:hypothetical protein
VPGDAVPKLPDTSSSTSSPRLQVPDADLPDASVPDVSLPQNPLPDVNLPAVKAPDVGELTGGLDSALP